MTISQFPPLDTADEDGLLAIGGDLDVDSLLLAYRSGIFPWPLNSEILAWFSPPKRAVLFFNELHISKSLEKSLRHSDYEIAFDRNTARVIRSCSEAKNRKGQRGTWITKDMVHAYIRLHEAGYCHSVEYYKQGELQGGLYGVRIGGFFAGESMFHIKRDASKICLLNLVERLKSEGMSWLDCQAMTPLLASFGAREIERDQFLELLSTATRQKD